MRILLTSGGTRVKIDKVRHIGNMSSGTFGAAIGKALMKEKYYVDFLKAEHSKSPLQETINFADYDVAKEFKKVSDLFEFWNKYKDYYKEYVYKTYEEYEENLIHQLKTVEYDYVILAAAVSDYLVENYVDGKIRSSSDLNIKLKPATKLISKVKEIQPKTNLIGFKLLVNSTEKELIEAAKKSIVENKCTFVVANDLADIQNNNHTLLIIDDKFNVKRYSKNDYPILKDNLARQVASTIYHHFNQGF